MKYDAQLKLQAYLDGELNDKETREVANWVAKDQDASLLFTELSNTRKALVVCDAIVPLPESREFFWSKIQRQIEREQPRAEVAPERETVGSFWRKFLLPASAVAAFGVAILFVTGNFDFFGGAAGPEVEAAVADPGAFTYRDYAQGTTLVWLSYPAENEVAPADGADKLR